MFENIGLTLYMAAGFIITYFSLEMAWHITACRIHDKTIKPCMFKQVRTVLVKRSNLQ